MLLARPGRIHPGVVGLLEYWKQLLSPVDFLMSLSVRYVHDRDQGATIPGDSRSQHCETGSPGKAYAPVGWL